MVVSFDAGATLAERMRRHAGDQPHLYGHVTRAMADDWDQGGPVRAICAGREDAPAGSVLQLRLLAGLFRIVLTDRAEQLVPYYPCLGGTADPAGAWAEVRPVLGANIDELRQALAVAPQTNEVGRANALIVGLFRAVARTGRRRIRLLEPGASAGLNLLVDAFRFANESWSYGPMGSPVQLDSGVEGDVHPVSFEMVERRGCDLEPVNISTAEGRLRLRSFVWPFHVERHRRLSAALQMAQLTPPVVDRAPAGEWLEQQLAGAPGDDVLTVVWQSITRLYWPATETERVRNVVAQAARDRPLAHITMEYDGGHDQAHAVLSVAWSPKRGGDLAVEQLGTVGDHGFPVRLA